MKYKKIIAFLLVVLSIPALGALQFLKPHQQSESVAVDANAIAAEVPQEPETLALTNHKTGETQQISVADYIKGVVAAEMPISFEPEALKAQAVASHTYAIHIYQQQGQLTTDPSVCQAYLSPEELQAKYKDNYQANWSKISDAVDAVSDQIMVYDSQPIVATYHSMSSGITESSKEVWGGDLPYLQPVSSEADPIQPNYETQVCIDFNTVEQKLKSSFSGLELPENPANWFQVLGYDPSGYVDTVKVGNIEITGTQARAALGLKSADFSVTTNETEFVFTTKGNGHGVGMSQYGANGMAQQGCSYDKILSHYYQGVKIITLS